MNFGLHLPLVAMFLGLLVTPVGAGPNTAPAVHPVVYAVDVNGIRVSDGALLLAASAQDVYARSQDLQAWRILVPAGSARIIHDSATYIALNALPGITASFDAATQTLALHAGSIALRTTEMQLREQGRMPVARPAGAFADYAFAAAGGGGANGVAAELDTGFAAFGGVVRNDLGWAPGALSRLQTSWQRDDPQRMRTLVVGDTTTPDTKTAAALRLAGVRWASDFSEQPQFSTFPGFDIRGAATVPSALDVYVNDILALRRDVPAGAYALRDLPLFDGAGTVQVRTTDAAGGLSRLSMPYYVSRNLLKPGLAAFSYSAGLLDADGAYGPFIVEGSRRWGITDRFTAGGTVQHGADRTILGADTDWLAGHSGVLSFASAASRSGEGAGMLWDAGYDYSGRRLTVGAELKVASAGFRSLDPTALAIGREVNLHAALRLTRATLAQASLVRDATIAGPVSLWTLGIAGNKSGTPYSVTAYRSAGAANAFGLTCVWSVPFGRRSTLSSQVGTGSNSAQSQIQFAGSTNGDHTAVAWDFAAGLTRGADSAARISASNDVGQFDLDALSSAGFSTYTARVEGGVAAIGGKVTATRQVTGSFALIRVPGFAGIDVYVNARYAGKTDARGELVTVDLVPFVENDVRIDPTALPLSASFASLTRTVVPTAFGGTTIEFAAHVQTEVRLTLRSADGKPLGPGTLVRTVDGSEQWPVGLAGHIDLIGIAPGAMTLSAGEGTAACRFTLDVPAGIRMTTLPDAACI